MRVVPFLTETEERQPAPADSYSRPSRSRRWAVLVSSVAKQTLPTRRLQPPSWISQNHVETASGGRKGSRKGVNAVAALRRYFQSKGSDHRTQQSLALLGAELEKG